MWQALLRGFASIFNLGGQLPDLDTMLGELDEMLESAKK